MTHPKTLFMNAQYDKTRQVQWSVQIKSSSLVISLYLSECGLPLPSIHYYYLYQDIQKPDTNIWCSPILWDMTWFARRVRRFQHPFALTAEWTTHKSSTSQKLNMLVSTHNTGINYFFFFACWIHINTDLNHTVTLKEVTCAAMARLEEQVKQIFLILAMIFY